MQPVFWIEQYRLEGGLVLALRGELDIAGVPAVGAIVAELCIPGIAEFGLDLTGLDFLDSTGLAALLATADLCEDRGARFWATHSTPTVERVLEIAGVRERLPLGDEWLPSGSPRRLWPAAPAEMVEPAAREGVQAAQGG